MLIIVHLSLMIIAFLCLAAGVSIAKFGRKQKNWLTRHKSLNSAGLIVILAGAVTAAASVISFGGTHLSGWHQRLGLATVILCALTLFFGLYTFKAANKTRVRTIHRWSGRTSLVAMVATLLLGLRIIGIF